MVRSGFSRPRENLTRALAMGGVRKGNRVCEEGEGRASEGAAAQEPLQQRRRLERLVCRKIWRSGQVGVAGKGFNIRLLLWRGNRSKCLIQGQRLAAKQLREKGATNQRHVAKTSEAEVPPDAMAVVITYMKDTLTVRRA